MCFLSFFKKLIVDFLVFLDGPEPGTRIEIQKHKILKHENIDASVDNCDQKDQGSEEICEKSSQTDERAVRTSKEITNTFWTD